MSQLAIRAIRSHNPLSGCLCISRPTTQPPDAKLARTRLRRNQLATQYAQNEAVTKALILYFPILRNED